MFRNTLADLHNPSDDIVYGFTQPDGLQGTRQFHHWPRFGVDEDVLDIQLEDLGHEGRRRRSMYGKRRGFTPEERTKRVILCFIVVIVVILLLVGGIFPAIFLSTQLTAQEQAAMTPESEFVGGNVTFDIPYVQAYNDPTTVEYQTLAQNFITEMDNLFMNDEGYLQTVVHEVTPGSVRIRFESIYTQATDANIPFKETFREKLEEEAQTGNLGQFVFVPSTLVVFDVCNLYCFNGGTVNRAIDVCACSCPDGFLPPSCQAPTTTMIPTQPATTTGKPLTTTISQTTGVLATTKISTTTEKPTTAALPAITSTAKVSSTTELPVTAPKTSAVELSETTSNPTVAPISTEMAMTTEEPQTTAMPTTTELATTVELSTTAILPTTPAIPTTAEMPTTTEIPTTTEMPTTTEIPTTTEMPTTTEVPTTTELPTTTAIPTTTEMPTTTEIPTTAELSTVPGPILHCHAFEYRRNKLRFDFPHNDEIVDYWHRDFPYPRFPFCLDFIDEPFTAGPDGFECPDYTTLEYYVECLEYHYRILESRSHCNLTQSTSCPSLEELYREINDTFGTDDPTSFFVLEIFTATTFRECLAIGDNATRILFDGFECPPAEVVQEHAECLDYHFGSVVLNGQTFTGNASGVCKAPPVYCPSFLTFLDGDFYDYIFGGCGCPGRRRKRDHGSFYSSESLLPIELLPLLAGVQGRRGCYNGFAYPRLLYCLDNPSDDSICPDEAVTQEMWLCTEYHFGNPDAHSDSHLSPEDCPCLDDFLEMIEATFGREEPPDCVCNDRRYFVGNNSAESLSGMSSMDLCGFVQDFPFPLLTHCLIELYSDLLPSSTNETFICPEPEVLDYFDICLDNLFGRRDPPDGWNGTCPCAGELYQELYDTFGYDLPVNFVNEINRGCVCFANESFDGEKFDELEFAVDRYKDCVNDPSTTFNNGTFPCPAQFYETFHGCFEFYFGNYSAPLYRECPPQDELIEVFVDTFMGDDVPTFDCNMPTGH